MRIFACGGDGTLFDVVNGVYGWPNVEVGCIPTGSGNDYIKNFGSKNDFLNIKEQIKGSGIPVDITSCNGEYYSINIASAGFDAEVCCHKNKMKKLSRLSGKLSYNAAIFKALMFNIKNPLKITIDGNKIPKTNYLFVLAANGKYYGSSFMPAPDAAPNDGLLEAVTIKSVPRLKILSLLSAYKKGTHVGLTDICTVKKAETLCVESDREFSINLDGEVFKYKKAEFVVLPNALKFILPSHITVKNDKIKQPAFPVILKPLKAAKTECK